MAGHPNSLGILAAIANEQRAALMQGQGGVPMVQVAQPLGRGALPLLARQLFLPRGAMTNQLALQPATAISGVHAVGKLDGKLVAMRGEAISEQPANFPAVPKPSTGVKSVSPAAPAVPSTPAKPTPKRYLEELFSELEIGEELRPKRFKAGDFVRPDPEECKNYDQAARLVRTNDLEKLRVLHKEGENLDACNRVGESLLHLACRRGHVGIAEFLMNEAKVRWDHQDDFGRSILHDAIWRPSPSIELMEAILKVVSPEWLLVQDIRGHTPFDYARREHSSKWYDFLKNKEDMLRRRLALLT